MLKIGIVTFHRAISYGAGYQAYALQQSLTKLGYDVEIIDYVPDRFTGFNLIFVQPKAKNILNKIVRYLPFAVYMGLAYQTSTCFVKKHLVLSKNRYKAPESLRELSSGYDIFVTGSDQVWNPNFDSLDNVAPYFLSFASENAKKVSYAASIALPHNDLTKQLFGERLLELLSEYNAISVREKSGVEMLHELGFNAVQVLDPTFLLSKKDWMKIARYKRRKRPFVFVYGLYRNSNLYEAAFEIAKGNGFDVVNLASTTFDFCPGAVNKIFVSNEELLGMLMNAECILTDSFHGAALSLNFNTPFYIFNALRYNERVENLIKIFSLESRRVNKDTDFSKFKMDFAMQNEILLTERKKSISYIKENF